MKKTLLLLISLCLSSFSYADAVTYDLAKPGINICDNNAGQLEGTVYRCSTGSLTLKNGDSVIYSGNSGGKAITLEVMHGDIVLQGNNSVGSQHQRINLKTSSVASNLQAMKPSEIKNNKKKDSSVYRDIVIKNGSTVWGDIYAHNDVVIKQSVIQGNIISDGGDVTTDGSGNKIFGNVTALHAVAIKQALVCGTLESKGNTVTVENSNTNGQGNGGGNQNGVFSLHDAIKSHGQVALEQADVCGSINSQASQYYYKQDRRYCGVNDPNCNYAPDGKCSISGVKAVCGWDVEPEPKQCKPLPPENFDNGSLANWSVMGFKSSDGEISKNPQAIGKRFRLNANIQNQATASAYNYVFPSAQNYLQVEFDHYAHSGTGGDGIALVLSDAKVPPQTGAFGGPLGYGMKRKINHPEEHLREDVEGFAGGWLGVGFDEYGNYYRTGGETILQDQTLKPNVVGIRGEGALDANGKWLNGYEFIKGYGLKKNEQPAEDIDGRNGGLHRYRIILNSRTAGKYYLSVERKIGSQQWKTLIEKFDVYQQGNFNTVPENFRLSVTASTGWATNIHEIDDFQVCADKYKKLTDGIHHFEFDYSGSGSTCQPSKVTLKACMNERCTQTYPEDAAASEGELEPLTVTLLPSSTNSVANWVNGEQEKLTDITFNNSVDLLLQGYKAGTVTMGVANSSVPQFGFEGARCRINNGDELSVENCNVLFSQNVLGVNIGDVVSARQSAGTDHLSFCSSHVKAGGESRDVTMKVTHEIAPVDKTKSVEVWYKKAGDSNAKWSGHTVLQPQVAKSLSDVYFDSNGKAYLKVNYKEVGKIRIDAKVNDVKDSAGFASFVSFPAKLSLNVSGNGACLPDCKSYIPAGQEFTMQVTAYQSDGEVARNYQESHISIDHVVTYPDPTTSVNKGNVVNGSLLTEKLPEDAKWVSGSVSFKQSVDEVGSFEFTATAPVGGEGEAFSTYLGSSTYKIADATLNVGRFYPSKFNVYSGDQTTSYNNIWDYPNGQAFAYMGQPFGLKQFYVEALSKGDGALHNYAYFDARHQAKFNLYEDNYANVNRFSAPGTYTGNWLNGSKGPYVSGQSVGKYSASGLVWSKVVTQPDGPLNYLENSSDTSISIVLSSSSVDKAGVSIGVKQLLKQPDIRFGRVDLDDVGGRQSETLHIPLRVEYWNSNLKRFVRNVDDDRTVVYSDLDGDPDTIWPDDKSGCSILLEGNDTVTDGVTWDLSARQDPNTCNPVGRQQSRLWLQLEGGSNNLPWLKYDWDKDGSEENPSSVVTFGIHRGNDRVIYRGEPGLTGQ
ncbi:TPA: DUF6701 domain-containing protein [Vibrio parahaemolyticus]|uniref:DUF6701 domain-containing protein n=1 Tax=Vibrio parahaemolyticus TaxID=670 RepID=UPI0015DF70D8|nr:DUF6701 domain-containing protein [Vibrio parahaemolyticus]MDF4613302.1 hypothetical protein [Vibrio parahaemolyticus]HCG7921505.1 hypothetical protein [Vibrio parahaemolyticus]